MKVSDIIEQKDDNNKSDEDASAKNNHHDINKISTNIGN